MPQQITIRRADERDATAVLDCLHAAFEPYRKHYSPEGFADTTLTEATIGHRLATFCVFVAEANGQIAGTIACNVNPNGDGHLRGMAVLAAWQGRGVADALLHAAEDQLKKDGCKRITLDTTAPLERAIRFYEKHGYRGSGVVGDFYGMPLYEYVKEQF